MIDYQPYIPEPDRSKITNLVYQNAIIKENPWIDSSLNDRVKMVRNRWDYLELREKFIAANPRIRKNANKAKGITYTIGQDTLSLNQNLKFLMSTNRI
jgi:hypothetical protein